MASIRLEGLGKSFGEVEAVRSVSLTTGPEEFLVLLGPSGCGKTTVLRMLAGLLTPTAGRILLDDRDITVVPPKSRDLAMVFQNYALYPHMTVAKNIGFALKLQKVSKREIDGASSWRILWRVVVPNIRAPLAALAILLFVSAWNEYFWPLLVLNDLEKSVVQIGLQMYLDQEAGDQWGPLMAAAGIATLPILVLYVVLQRHVIDAFVRSGLK